MTTPTPPERPKPLTNLAAWLGPGLGLIGAIVGFLVPLGLVSQAEADLINQFSHAVIGDAYATFGPQTSLTTWTAVASGLIAGGSTIGAVFAHARLGRQNVTPLSDPRDSDGTRLVRIDALPRPRPTVIGSPAEPNGIADHARPDLPEEHS